MEENSSNSDRNQVNASINMPIDFHTISFSPSVAEAIVLRKIKEYSQSGRIYQRVYYATRLSVGLCSGALPFVVSNNPMIATVLSAIIVVGTVIDTIFNPREKWALYSKAEDLLTVEKLKLDGQYDKYKEALDLLVLTEEGLLKNLVSIQKVREEGERSSKSSSNPT